MLLLLLLFLLLLLLHKREIPHDKALTVYLARVARVFQRYLRDHRYAAANNTDLSALSAVSPVSCESLLSPSLSLSLSLILSLPLSLSPQRGESLQRNVKGGTTLHRVQWPM